MLPPPLDGYVAPDLYGQHVPPKPERVRPEPKYAYSPVNPTFSPADPSHGG